MYSYELSATPASLESAESSLLSLCRFLEVCASVYGSECVSACRSALHQTFKGGESTLWSKVSMWCVETESGARCWNFRANRPNP